MGSFLVSCSLTRQSIQEGEEVYIIPVVQQRTYEAIKLADGGTFHSHEHPVYNTDFYQPVGFMFQGTYADYGRYYINWGSAANQKILEGYYNHLRKYHVPVLQGSNSCHDIPVNLPEITSEEFEHESVWDMLHEAVWENRLLIESKQYSRGSPVQVEYCILHKKHTDTLLEMYLNQDIEDSWTGRNDPEYTATFKMNYQDKFLKVFELRKTRVDELHKLIAEFDYDTCTDEEKTKVREYYRELHQYEFPSSSRQFQFFLSSNGGSSLEAHAHSSDVQQTLDTIDVEMDRFEAFTLFHKLRQIIISMDMVNMYPVPVYYASQDYGNAKGLIYAELMCRVQETNKQDILKDDWREVDTIEEVEAYIAETVKSFSY